MKKTFAVVLVASMVYSLSSCKKDAPANSAASTEKSKDINAACTAPPTFVAVRTIGGPGRQHGDKVTIAANGDVTLAGLFENTVDFDPGAGVFKLTAQTQSGTSIYYPYNTFIQKSTSAGGFISAESKGILQADTIKDEMGNRYLSTYEGNPGANWNKPIQVVVIQFSPSGKIRGKSYLGEITGTNYQTTIVPDMNGSVYLLGPKGMVIKSTLNGKVTVMGQTNSSKGGLITYDAAGNIYTAGYGYIQKFGTNGGSVWARRNGAGNNKVQTGKLIVDKDGNVYTMGTFSEDSDFDPGAGNQVLTASSVNSNVYMQKLTSAGKLAWVVQTQNAMPSSIQPLDMALDASAENIYLTGGYTGNPNFNPTGGTGTAKVAGGIDVFVLKLRQCK